jgi:hypothetical protein
MTIGIIAILIIAAITGIILYLKKKKKKENVWKFGAWALAKTIIDTTSPETTPANHKIYKDVTVTNLNPEANDEGIEETFKKGECANYPVDRSRHRVSTVVFPSIPDSQGDPCYKEFISPGNPYYGTEWDGEAGKGEEADHYVKVAGQTVAVGEPYGDVIVIPEHTANQSSHQSLVTSFEMEHVCLAYYDGYKFEETKYHLTGGHPLIADCVEGLRKLDTRYHAASWKYESTEEQADGFTAKEIYTCALLTK